MVKEVFSCLIPTPVPCPPPPPAPQDLDEFIFHWEGELPTTSQR